MCEVPVVSSDGPATCSPASSEICDLCPFHQNMQGLVVPLQGLKKK